MQSVFALPNADLENLQLDDFDLDASPLLSDRGWPPMISLQR